MRDAQRFDFSTRYTVISPCVHVLVLHCTCISVRLNGKHTLLPLSTDKDNMGMYGNRSPCTLVESGFTSCR